MNIDYIHGFNKSGSLANILLAVYGNDVVNVDTGLGYSRNLISPDLSSMETFLDTVFLQDYNIKPTTFNGSAWGERNAHRMHRAKHQKRVKTTLYLGNVKLSDPDAPALAGPWPSRVVKCDLPQGGELTWGAEWGSNLSTTQGSKVVIVANSIQDFKLTNIKVGDPFFIFGPIEFQSFVFSVDSRYQITLTDEVPATISGNGQFFVGSNYFDVATDDNDFINGLGENNDKLLIFKQYSIWSYNGVLLKRINDAPGTTSRKSIINHGRYTFYFHGSNQENRRTGMYLCDGNDSTLITRPIQPYINAINPSFYSKVVAWREGSRLRWFVGDLSNESEDIDIQNAVITYDVLGGQLSIDPISDLIKSVGRFIEAGEEKYFLGDNTDEVFESQQGYTFDGKPITWEVRLGKRFPSGTSILNKFTRIIVVSKNGRGISVGFKRIGKPDDSDKQWFWLGDLKEDYQELTIDIEDATSRGFDLIFKDMDGNANNFVLEKVTVFYVPVSMRSVV